MSTASPIGWYVAPDMHLTFMPGEQGTIQALVETDKKEQLPVKIPACQFICQSALTVAEKVVRILRNCHLFPQIKGQEVHFAPTADVMEWKEVSKKQVQQLRDETRKWITRMDGRISYVRGDTVMTWNWKDKTCIPVPYAANITALAELPDGTLVVGDTKGVLHYQGKKIEGLIESCHGVDPGDLRRCRHLANKVE